VNCFFDGSSSCPLDLTIAALTVLGSCCLPLRPLSISAPCTGQARLHGTFHATHIPLPSLARDRRAFMAPSMQHAFPSHPLHRTGVPAWHLPCSVHWICSHPLHRTGAPSWHLPCNMHSPPIPCAGQARLHGTFHAVCIGSADRSVLVLGFYLPPIPATFPHSLI
jgi:hypothetical protein